MAKTDFKTAEDYIATFPAADQEALQAIRAAIRAGAPDAEEVISYQIPAFKLDGFVLYYSAFAHHFNLSAPPPTAVYEAFKDQLAAYETTKSAIRLPKSRPLPLALITDLAAFRAQENRARAAAKPKAKTKAKTA